MPWFPVDDSFHSHPKVLATSLAARGLWATAGSWCSDTAHLTDGVIPGHVLAALGGTPELAAELVAAGLWRRTRKGYAFHDWFQWGSKRTAEQQRALSAVRAANGRIGGVASGKTRAKHEANPKQLASPLVHGGLNPNTSTKDPPQPPTATAAGGHHGQHPNCRTCGTNPRGHPPPQPASDAERHPSARPVSQAALDAALTPNAQPARGETVTRLADQARQAIHQEKP